MTGSLSNLMSKLSQTQFHHPHEYEIVSRNEDAHGKRKVIYIGTFKQCQFQLREIRAFDYHYGQKCDIEKA
jgi:hypothetical protein